MKEWTTLVHEVKNAFTTRTLTAPLHESFVLFMYTMYKLSKYYIILSFTKIFAILQHIIPIHLE